VGQAQWGLTTRGRAFVAAALAVLGCAILLGQRDLLRIGALLAVLPALSAFYVGRARDQLACERLVTPTRVPAGAPARITLRLSNRSRLPTGTLLLEDRLPYALGSRPRLVLERLAGQRTSTVAYTVHAEVRGRYELGPLTIRVTDPFGLCQLTRVFPTAARLTVVPAVETIPTVRLAGESVGSDDSRARSVAIHGEDDAATREYRHGDDLRRVHWRSTARAGELMVRREEQPFQTRATVVLDSRRQGHRGEGRGSSFEWAVSATASVALHLRRNAYKLRMVTGGGVDLDASEHDGEGVLLDALAEAEMSLAHDIVTLVDRIRRRDTGGLVVATFGALTLAEADMLASLRNSGTTCVALLIDPATWLTLPDEARAQSTTEHDRATGTLLRSGWRVVSIRHGDTLAARWPQAARGARSFAWRAPMAETVGTSTAVSSASGGDHP
jgi:uncharacterized protein (DUF58 family)